MIKEILEALTVQTAINIVCIVGILYCSLLYLFRKIKFKVIEVKDLGNDVYIVTVKRLWRVYEYVTDSNLEVYDIDRNIKFRLPKINIK